MGNCVITQRFSAGKPEFNNWQNCTFTFTQGGIYSSNNTWKYTVSKDNKYFKIMGRLSTWQQSGSKSIFKLNATLPSPKQNVSYDFGITMPYHNTLYDSLGETTAVLNTSGVLTITMPCTGDWPGVNVLGDAMFYIG